MFEHEKIGGIDYKKMHPLHGFTIYFEASFSKLTQEHLTHLISKWEKPEFMKHIGDDADEIFRIPGQKEPFYEMVYKPGSWTVVLVRQRHH